VVSEVLSENSGNTDVVVLQQTKAAAVVFSNRGNDWISEVLTAADTQLPVPEIRLTVLLASLYPGAALDGEF